MFDITMLMFWSHVGSHARSHVHCLPGLATASRAARPCYGWGWLYSLEYIYLLWLYSYLQAFIYSKGCVAYGVVPAQALTVATTSFSTWYAVTCGRYIGVFDDKQVYSSFTVLFSSFLVLALSEQSPVFQGGR